MLTAGPTEVVPTDRWQLTVSRRHDRGHLRLGRPARPRARDPDHRHPLRHALVEARHDLARRARRTLLEAAGVDDLPYALAHSYGGYTTNVPLEDLVDGDAMVAVEFEGEPLEAEHGGPARLLVPHLYFWKSAKWVARIELLDYDQPGFWEVAGYHNHGDPFLEQRYHGD